MKQRVTITVDEETLQRVREGIRSKKFRNRSHAFELAIYEVTQDDA